MKTRLVIPPRTAMQAWVRRAAATAAAAALVSLALEYGFEVPPLPVPALIATQLVAVVVYVFSRAYTVWTARNRWTALRSCWIDGLLLLGAGLYLLIRLEPAGGRTHVLSVSALYVAVIQVVLLIRLAIAGIALDLHLSQSRLHPTRVLAITFLALIILGSLALALPKATHPQVRSGEGFSIPLHLLNSVFTATSATCVTGLVVYDTGTDYTRFGQVVILLLIQAGGLGIMIFGSLFGLLVGRQLSLRHSLVLQDAISYQTLGRLRMMVVFILIFTFTAEAIGAVMLYPMWEGMASPADRAFHSAFHAISAFCNAGFALQTDSLTAYSRAWQVYGGIMPLIILGGLGFPVLHDLWRGATSRVRQALTSRAGVALSHPKCRRHRFTLHSKIVLITTAALIVLPTVAFFVFESFSSGAGPAVAGAEPPATMASASPAGRMLDALFYSITCRTAGFNTVAMNLDSMSPASHMLGAILMFVGGSPASTAGGIKTVGLAVLVLGVWSTLRGRTNVEAMGRTIPDIIVRRAAVVVIVMFGLVSLVTLLLCFTEQISLREALFETVSACGTVGLSTGLTPDLTPVGRLAIMMAMFAGRLGPLTVLIALAGRSGSARYDYPVETVGIG